MSRQQRAKQMFKLPVDYEGCHGNHTPVSHFLTAVLERQKHRLESKPQTNSRCVKPISFKDKNLGTHSVSTEINAGDVTSLKKSHRFKF